MRFALIILLFCCLGSAFPQDTLQKILLKPIDKLVYSRNTAVDRFLIDKDSARVLDSMKSCALCKQLIKNYNCLYENWSKRKLIDSITQKVEELNEKEKHSGYYYYMDIDKVVLTFDFSVCGYPGKILEAVDYEVKIRKEEKSHIIFDGSSGGVYYYEDLKHMAW